MAPDHTPRVDVPTPEPPLDALRRDVLAGLAALEERVRQHITENTAETRQYIDGGLAETRQHIDAGLAETRQHRRVAPSSRTP